MDGKLDKERIIVESKKVFQRLHDYCNQLPDEVFFGVPEGKWTVAQHVQHLIISVRTTTAAYAIPKFLVRWIGGSPTRFSMTFSELTSRYQLRLQNGGKASGRYIPKEVPAASGKAILLKWEKVTAAYLRAIEHNWNDEQLDKYLVSHPLLGKITLRELCYFTLHHTEHHLKGIKQQSLLF